MKDIINQKWKKIKSYFKYFFNTYIFSDEFFFILILIFCSSASFFLGKISMVVKMEQNKKEKITLIKNNKIENIEVIASKNGKVFHLPWCGGAIRIKEENKISFKNKELAIKSGYRASKSCEGL